VRSSYEEEQKIAKNGRYALICVVKKTSAEKNTFM